MWTWSAFPNFSHGVNLSLGKSHLYAKSGLASASSFLETQLEL